MYRVIHPIEDGKTRWEPGDELAADELLAGEVEEFLAAGILEPLAAPTEGGPSDPGARQAAIVAGIAQLTPGNEDHWTRGGKPEIAALKEITGLTNITGAERDAAWAAHQGE